MLIVFSLKMLKDNDLLEILCFGLKPGEKYPPSVRHFCLALRYHSPRAYNQVRQQFHNNLPHEKTVQHWLAYSDIPAEPGIHDCHMKKLKKIVKDFEQIHKVPLLCSLVFDEINIRKQIFWSLQQSKYVGYVEDVESEICDQIGEQKTAKQAIVFLLNGINGHVEFPVAFYFIDTLNKTERKQLLLRIISHVSNSGAIIANTTCDGYSSNISMYELLGANLDVLSDSFRPSFRNPCNNEEIQIIFDPCHMEKLVRNTLARKGVLYDDRNYKIEWKYFELLYEYSKKHSLWTHGMTKKHMQWQNNIMNVQVAVQTMSDSVANSMEVLMRNGHPDFRNAGATIRFIRIMNSLFDIFNSMSSRSQDANPYKNPMNMQNKRIIFDFFESTTNYLKSLKIDDNRIGVKCNNIGDRSDHITQKISIVNSRNKTGFRGFCINMQSLRSIYCEYVGEKKYLKSIATYNLLQDSIEIFLRRIRACCGFNNNPNMDQFRGAYRKLVANMKIVLSGRGNYRVFDYNLPDTMNYSDIYFISSRRAIVRPNDTDSFQENYEKQKDSILHEAAQIVEYQSCYHLIDGSADWFNVFIAAFIEQKIMKCPRFYCQHCREVFHENDKIMISSNWNALGYKPCISTIEICKISDRFFKVYNAQKTKYDFSVLYCLIFRTMEFSKLYPNSRFECDISHKYQFIKCIVGQYLIRKATDIAKELTYDQYEKMFRQRLSRLILFSGQ